MIDKPELEIPTGLKALGMTSCSVLRIFQTTIYPLPENDISSPCFAIAIDFSRLRRYNNSIINGGDFPLKKGFLE